jgi:hypothetical protein
MNILLGLCVLYSMFLLSSSVPHPGFTKKQDVPFLLFEEELHLAISGKVVILLP